MLAQTLGALGLGLGLMASAWAQGDLAACEAPPATAPLAQRLEARAYWLDGQHLQWPGLAPVAGSRVRLLHAPQGSIQAQPGQVAAGFAGALPLTPAKVEREARWRFVGEGPAFELAGDARGLLREQLVLVQEDAEGRVLQATATQIPGALDALYVAAEAVPDLGATLSRGHTDFKLWAPTAAQVWLCRYRGAEGPAIARAPMRLDAATGVWSLRQPQDLSGQAYRFLVDVMTPSHGRVLNLVTDPYAAALTVDSTRSVVADLDGARLKPRGWDGERPPRRIERATDQVIYELHVRDFSASDASVRPAWRGKYLAFTEPASRGMAHLRALARAGLTDVHLLPVFDFATVPERGCVTPAVPEAGPAGEAQQAVVMAVAAKDCFNWGYDPLHFGAPEGSYAVDPLQRVLEFRRMVQALHRAGLRVGMDMVYNHMSAAGQDPRAVLDRIVPGYYHRLDAKGQVERSTCCDNTATEHRMMAKLMIDTAERWVRAYRIDSMRFDLMGHQPREAMERLQARVNAAAGESAAEPLPRPTRPPRGGGPVPRGGGQASRPVQLLGEGWNFGEIANGTRFVQASQLSLNGSGIGSFSDRGRDAARGGGAGEGGDDAVRNQGWLNGLSYAPNALGGGKGRDELLAAADLIRVGLAGSIRDVELSTWRGERRRLEQIPYGDQPAGFVSEPGEVVNYVENHDNQTLWDLNALKLPLATSSEDRARVQALGMALTAFSQGIAYFHAGIDILRSKSMDRNSYDSGDWFNRLDWSYQSNHFGTGLPPRQDNFGAAGHDWALAAERLADLRLAATPRDIAWARDVFRDLLRIRAGTPQLRLASSAEIRRRLSFPGSGAGQNPTLVAVRIDGRGMPGFKAVMAVFNVAPQDQVLDLPEEAGQAWTLHPVLRAPAAADARVREHARAQAGRFEVPARSAAVFVIE